MDGPSAMVARGTRPIGAYKPYPILGMPAMATIEQPYDNLPKQGGPIYCPDCGAWLNINPPDAHQPYCMIAIRQKIDRLEKERTILLVLLWAAII